MEKMSNVYVNKAWCGVWRRCGVNTKDVENK